METEELRLPLKNGWRRETTVREYSKSGVRGDVCYYAPCGKKFKQYPDIVRVRTFNHDFESVRILVNILQFSLLQFLEKSGVKDLQREHFSFSTKIFIGEFLKPTGMMSDNGEEKYVTLNEAEMIADVDKIRKENGWKPRKRIGPLRSRDGGRRSNGDRGDVHNVEDQYKLLQKLQVELETQ